MTSVCFPEWPFRSTQSLMFFLPPCKKAQAREVITPGLLLLDTQTDKNAQAWSQGDQRYGSPSIYQASRHPCPTLNQSFNIVCVCVCLAEVLYPLYSEKQPLGQALEVYCCCCSHTLPISTLSMGGSQPV